MIDLQSMEEVAKLPRSKKLGIATAIIGWELTTRLLDELAEDDDYPLLENADIKRPAEVIRGVALSIYTGLLFDVWHRDWYGLGPTDRQLCMEALTTVFLLGWMEMSSEDVRVGLGNIEELYRANDSNWLLRIGKMMCPCECDITIIMHASVQHSSYMKYVQPDLLNQLAQKSELELASFIVDYTSELGEQ